jgi:hypothetical protein
VQASWQLLSDRKKRGEKTMERETKQTIRNSIRAGLLFGLAAGLLYGLARGPVDGVIIGILTGCIFGLFLGVFSLLAIRKFRGMRAEMAQQVSIVYDGGANHFVGIEGVGGWLFLTDRELIFKSHKFNVNRHELVVPLSDIASVKTGKSLGLIANKLTVQTKLGSSEVFVVNDAPAWLAKLQESRLIPAS